MKQKFQYALLILIIVLAIILFYVSLGKIDAAKLIEARQKRIQEINEKTEELNKSKNNKIERKAKLDKYVKRLFLAARILVGVLLIGINIFLFKFFILPELIENSFIQNFNHAISLFVDYNAIGLTILLLLFFILYESPFEIKDLKAKIHFKIRRIIYRNDTGLENEIIEIDNEIKKLNAVLKSLT